MLHLLVITSRPLMDDKGKPITLLDVEEERRRIRTALHHAQVATHVEYVPHATTGAVKTALRDAWNVVHFTGHGTDDGRLVLENEFGEAHALTPTETAQLFHQSRARLVVLSACHSETIARELRKAGVPALVAIDARKPIADRAATIFAEHFYGALARGWTIGKAFRDAQESVALDDSVGDKHPPLDDDGKPETPWSQRFTLIGDDTIAFAVEAFYETPQPEPRLIGNLRARNTNFVGRAKEIVEIVKQFDASKQARVALVGTPGIGKTELAKAVAWWYIERGKVDAVLWASASRDEGEFVLRDLGSLLAIAIRALRLPVTEQSSFDEQKRAVRDLCAAQRTIVILDNWETLEPRARKEVWDFVLSLPPSTRVIITSRETLPPKDARNYELDTLTIEDGARLFVNIARNAGYFDRNPTLSKEDVTILNAIVERLGGYPLAIEVVAGQTASRALDAIWRDLLQIPKNVLEGKDELTGEPRGVWTSLGFSYNVLPTREQTLFRRMGVFLAPARAEDVVAIVGETTDDGRPPTADRRLLTNEGRKPALSESEGTKDEGGMREALDALVRRSLVRMREGTYALLPIVREYALSQLEEAGEDARELHARAVIYYGQKGTLDAALIASEHLFELAARYNARSAAETFVKYVIRFYPALRTRGYWTEARRKSEQMILVARALGDKVTEAQAIG
ncbi:MAG: CHAT domain-containing protein, partial [Anaerolineae bacterium]|nr:CHAT domain-containing protein [Anaerolineae bacterium]